MTFSPPPTLWDSGILPASSPKFLILATPLSLEPCRGPVFHVEGWHRYRGRGPRCAPPLRLGLGAAPAAPRRFRQNAKRAESSRALSQPALPPCHPPRFESYEETCSPNSSSKLGGRPICRGKITRRINLKQFPTVASLFRCDQHAGFISKTFQCLSLSSAEKSTLRNFGQPDTREQRVKHKCYFCKDHFETLFQNDFPAWSF